MPYERIVEKGEIDQNDQFRLFYTMLSMQSVSRNPFIATILLLSAASLNLGRSQDGVREWVKTLFPMYCSMNEI